MIAQSFKPLFLTSVTTIASLGLTACFGAEEYADVGNVAVPGSAGGSASTFGVDGQQMLDQIGNPAPPMPTASGGVGGAAPDTPDPAAPPAATGGTPNGIGPDPMPAGGAPMGEEPAAPPPPTFNCEGLQVACVNGKSGENDCSGVDFLATLDGPAMQGGEGNDIWGWEDPMTGKEYVLMGLTNGTAFVDISDPCRPVHLGHLRTETVPELWRDIKVYKDHAYIVAESQDHGMQVFDLSKLRNVANPPVNFEADNVITTFGSAHNIVLNEESGFAYTVLNNNCTVARSFDLADPKNPVDLGCWGEGLRVHDAQCVNYKGPDPAGAGRELCFSGAEDAGVFVFDVTDKSNVTLLGDTVYENVSYAHQGWLTDDHRYFILGDEGDELAATINTTLYVFDVTTLSNPTNIGKWVGDLPATDHNLFIRGNYIFMASYAAGMRILDLANVAQGQLTEVGYFDTFPRHNNAGYTAVWGVYPYFKSGVVVTSGTSDGLYILLPDPMFMQ